MAVDQALLESVGAGEPPALRFYTWEPPCLSFGRNQPAAGLYDPERARARGIDLVRRPTGGRAVYHHQELTYAVAVPTGMLGSPRETYAAVNAALIAGLRRLGIPAALAGAAPVRAAVAVGAPLGVAPCFEAAMPGEVVVGGRKLVGSAQRREGGAFLQHGSILLAGSQAAAVELLRPGAAAVAAAPPPATLAEVLGVAPSPAALEAALVEGWQEATGTRLAPTPLSLAERLRADALVAQFGSDAWTWRR